MFFLYKLTTTSGWKMLNLHLLARLISSTKYWRVVKKLVPFLKEELQVKFYFYEKLTETKKKEVRFNFLKM